LAVIFNLEPARTLNDLVPAVTELDTGILASVAHRTIDGFDLYPGSAETDVHSIFTGDDTRSIIECCRAKYDLILIDLGTYINEAAAQVIRTADIIMPVTAPDVLSIRATARFVRLLERLGVNQENIKPVVNGWLSSDLALDRISAHIGARVIAGLPPSPRVRAVLDEGRLLTADDDPRLKDSINALARSLMSAAGIMDELHA
jgi:Flp pilus assembly CpaE family ATPase